MGHVVILRGPSGSGKSFVGHAFAERFPHDEVFEDGWNLIKPRLIGYRLPGNFYCLGSYRPAGGGLDTLSPDDRSKHFDLIKRYAVKGYVFAEALVLSTMVPKLLALGAELGPESISFPTMDTPSDLCVKQIYQRNGGKPIKEANVHGHRKSVDNGTKRLRDAGFSAPDIDHTHSFEQVVEIFRSVGWRPEEDSTTFSVAAVR